MGHHHHDHPETGSTVIDSLPTETEGLPEATRPEIVELSDGDSFNLEIGPVAKRIGEATVRMLAYNGSIPGPTLKIPQGATVTVHVTNRGDLEATVHWHGLRLENRFDGTHDTQAPIPVGETFTYRVSVPDPGAYWYHPHIREDYGQEMGLYANILVVPADADYWPPVHRELLLTLDDVLVEDGKVAPFSRTETTYSLAAINVGAEQAAPLQQQFGVLRANPEWVAERERLGPYVDAPPDKTLAFVAEM